MGLYSQTFYQNKRVLRRSIYIEPGWSPPVRNATYLQTFFRIYLCLSRDFVNKHVFLLLDLHWNSAKLPWGMQRICGPFVLRTIIMPFKRHSLIRSLYFIQVYINFFYTSDTLRPILSLFIHFTLHQFLRMYITARNSFLIPDDALLGILLLFLISAVKGFIWTTFFFFTFLVLIQWNFPWNISTNLLIFTNKASSYVVIV